METIKELNKIGNLLCDGTVGKLVKDEQIVGNDEEFGSLVTIGYLFRQITPILDKIRESCSPAH